MEKIALSVSEAAASLGVSKKTMYELIHTDGFPVKKLEGKYLIPVDGLKKWLES